MNWAVFQLRLEQVRPAAPGQEQFYSSSAAEAQAVQGTARVDAACDGLHSKCTDLFLSSHTVFPRVTPIKTTPKWYVREPAKEKAENFMVATTNQGHSANK